MADQERAGEADSTADDYQERVLRNEGRLYGLEQLVGETRDSDRKLIEQRSESLAQELERRAESLLELVTARADAVLVLSQTERQSDLREARDALIAHAANADERWSTDQKAMRLAVDTVADLFNEKIEALEERRIAATEALETVVNAWRESDREARVLLTIEINRRLDVLNHADSKRQEFQASAVTRELFNADKEAQTHRESVLREQITALDRALLGMTPTAVSDKAHSDMTARFEDAIAASAKTLDTRIDVNSDKINELKSSRDMLAGKSQGTTVTIGYLIAVATLTISLVVLFANQLIG
jgi:hypothetical protein